MILDGRVSVNGRIVSDPAYPGRPEAARIAIDGKHAASASWRTIALNKPRGVVTTRRDPEGRPTVFDVLGDEAGALIAIGRLDLATTGLLILTSDTQLANRLTDPVSKVIRTYVVTVRGWLSDDSVDRMREGLDGLRVVSVRVRKRSRRETHLIVELDEGKNREIRRLCTACGHEVTGLKRIAFGGLTLGDLRPGQWREVSRQEMTRALEKAHPPLAVDRIRRLGSSRAKSKGS